MVRRMELRRRCEKEQGEAWLEWALQAPVKEHQAL